MKKLKKPTTVILMATLIFSNMQLCPIYGDMVENTEKNTNKEESAYIKNYVYKSKDANNIVNIPDSNLKKAINEALYKESYADITKAELERIECLNLESRDIENLEGLQYCINLKGLYLSDNNISDIDVLSGLIKLENLYLNKNQINDIDSLSGLINLTSLILADNKISNINALSELTKLGSLCLENNQINDINGLPELDYILNLCLRNNQIIDISPLSKINSIDDLDLSNNKISDITPLLNIDSGLGMVPETIINLGSNPLNLNDFETKEVIQYLKSEFDNVYYDENSSLEEVISIPDINLKKGINEALHKNEYEDITKSELEKIKYLNLENRDIENLEGLQYCINLEDLYLNNNKISDVSALSQLTNLYSLYLNNNKISDISVLSELTNLYILSLNNNKISDISILANLDNIRHLYLSNNQINEIKSLPQLMRLWVLDLSNNQISDISPLADNRAYHYLDISNNNISDITPLSNIRVLDLTDESDNELKLFGNNLDLNDDKNKEIISNLWKKGFCVICNESTIILAEDKVIMIGDSFEELSEIYAEDIYGLDITDSIEVIENTVDISKIGVYKVIYKVTDSKGISTTKEIKVTVTNKIEGIDLGAGNGTESKPLEVLLQNDNAIDELFSKIESSFEYNIVDEPVIEGDYKIYKIKLNNKTVVANEQVKNNKNSSYIELKVNVVENADLIAKLDKIFEENNNDSNGGDAISPVPPTIEKPQIPEVPSVPPTQKPIEFNDIKGHWAEETIKEFTDKKFIDGYEDNTFKPNNNMTRAEFVKVVNKVFGYTQKGEEQFTDVNIDDWFYNDICIGIKEGYIKGKSKDIFAPNENITREEVAMILTNIMKNKDENLDKLNTFKDGNKTSQWAQSSVEGAIEAGYLNGDDKGLLNPTNNITRAEAISMLSRVK